MKITFYSGITLALLFLFAACSPVSKTMKIGSNSKNTEIESSENSVVRKDTIKKNHRFIDTVIVPLPDVKPAETKKSKPEPIGNPKEVKNNFENEFRQAVELYENGAIDKSRKKFSVLLATLNPSEPMYYETVYYLAECNITQNKLKDANQELLALYKNSKVSNELKEKIILRLGQICCYNKDMKNADLYFAELNEKFPESKLLPLANCNFLKNKGK